MVGQAFDDRCTGMNPRYPLMSEIRQMYLNVHYGEGLTDGGGGRIMNLARVIAVRNRKTIYRDGDRCIKVFRADYSKADVLNEALN